jgi:hypothetical protein
MPAVTPCPGEHALRRFLLGDFADLAAADLAVLTRHVQDCGPCAATVESLHADDSLVNALREAGPACAQPPEAPVQRLIERLCRTGPQYATATVRRDPDDDTDDEAEDVTAILRPPEGPDEIGRLGEYRVLQVLGIGGMGVVFLAVDPQLERLVALKTLKPAMSASAGARRRFLREARAIARVSHDNIISILHVGEDRGVPFLVMPFLQGETLNARLQRQGVLPAAEVLRLGRAVAAGLGAAHAQGLIHRDIKPSNIWLEGEGGQVRILDFGLARAVGGDAQLTQTGVVVGTPAYMAPEQARGEALDPRTDLFSLGCVLYRAVTGRLPFPGRNALATLLSLAEHRPTPPARLNPRLPPGLSELIMRLLAQRREDRHASAAAVSAALDDVAAGKIRPRRRRRRIAIAAAAALLLTAVAIACWTGLDGLRRSEETQDPAAAELFAPAVPYNAGLYPLAVLVADFNGDGKADLVVANQQSHSVSVLLGNGDGTFQAPITSLAGGWFAGPLAVADFNGDGKLDLVVVNGGSHQVSVLLGKGDGTFGPPVLYGVGTNPSGVVVADFDGDGKADLAVSNNDGTVSVLLGQGDGSFRPAVNYRAGNYGRCIVVGDFDRDGKLDLAVGNNDGKIQVLLGKGDGTFRPAFEVTMTDSPWALATADLNGDGKLDLVAGHNGGGLTVLLGNGDGTFQAPQHSRGTADYYSIVIADLDGDGRPDLALANATGNTIDVLLGNGDGTFQGPLTWAVGRTPMAVALGDFNRDGRPDLVAANKDSGSVSVLLHRPPPAYQAHLGPPVHYAAGTEPRAIVVGDLGRAGRDDLVVADYGGHVHVLRGQGDGTFRAAGSYPAGKGPAALALGDFNRDGRLGVAVADSLADTVNVLAALPDGTFGPPVSYPVGAKPVAVAVGDFDRDGRADLVVANYDAGTVSLLRGNGDGTFQQAAAFPAGGHPRAVAVADVNGDGVPDLVVANRFQVGTVSVLLGRGDGTFAAPVAYPVGSFPVALVVADFNGDGKPDLAVLNWGSQDVNVLLGNGDGTFQTAVNYAAGNMPQALAAADVNGDGKLDLVVTEGQQHAVRVLLGEGDGSFPKVLFSNGTGLYPTGVAVGRFRGGGRPDVVTANAHSGNVTVLLNRPSAAYLQGGLAVQAIDQDGTSCSLQVISRSACGTYPPAVDADFRGSVRLHSSDPLAVLPQTITIGPTDGGVGTLPVKFRTPGSQTITLTDGAGRLLSGSCSFWVHRTADLKFMLELPKEVEAGKHFGMTVNVMDRFDRWTAGYGGTVRFHCTEASATLPADYTFDRVESLHTFTSALALPNPGTWTVTVTDTTVPTLTASATVTVRPARDKAGP